MMTMKSLPSTYNKDLQSDKVTVFTAFDQLKDSIALMTGVLGTFTANKIKCESGLSMDMLATDLVRSLFIIEFRRYDKTRIFHFQAYYLVRKNLPFRTAHHHAGEVVALAEQMNVSIDKVPLEDMQKIW